MSYCTTLYNNMVYNATTYRATIYHATVYHIALHAITTTPPSFSRHIILYTCIGVCTTILYCTTLRADILYRIASYRTVPYYKVLDYGVPCHNTPYDIIFDLAAYCMVLYHTLLYCIAL